MVGGNTVATRTHKSVASCLDDDEMQISTVELIDEEEDAVESEVSPPRRTRSGREVVRPHRFRDN